MKTLHFYVGFFYYINYYKLECGYLQRCCKHKYCYLFVNIVICFIFVV